MIIYIRGDTMLNKPINLMLHIQGDNYKVAEIIRLLFKNELIEIKNQTVLSAKNKFYYTFILFNIQLYIYFI